MRAVQYLRMSTDHQRYSLRNQATRIADYAAEHGIEIVGSYEDAGKSGVTIRGREGLKKLLSHALSPERAFEAILVLDISRWGRFQDPDQAAHYEFVCRDAGVEVIYCAEPFENDASPVSSLVKAMKRVMAAEYSKELSSKIAFAKARSAELGFKQGGPPPFGFRRQVIGSNGESRGILKKGEYKGYQADRVRYALGPAEEIDIIRCIFRWRVRDLLSVREIAKRLNETDAPRHDGKPWSPNRVRGVLHNDLVTGILVYGRVRSVLGKRLGAAGEPPCRVQVCKPIISKATFLAASRVYGFHMSPDEMIALLRRHLREMNGRVTQHSINACPYLPSAQTFKRRFGSLRNAYQLIGHTMVWRYLKKRKTMAWRTDADIIDRLQLLHNQHGHISVAIIGAATDLPSASYLSSRFGNLKNLYRLAGLPCTKSEILQVYFQRRKSTQLLAQKSQPGRD